MKNDMMNVLSLLKKYYALNNIISILKNKTGNVNNVYLVKCEDNLNYYLKLFDKRFNQNNIKLILKIHFYMATYGIAPQIIEMNLENEVKDFMLLEAIIDTKKNEKELSNNELFVIGYKIAEMHNKIQRFEKCVKQDGYFKEQLKLVKNPEIEKFIKMLHYGVIHGDLRYSNILFLTSDNIMFIDFDQVTFMPLLYDLIKLSFDLADLNVEKISRKFLMLFLGYLSLGNKVIFNDLNYIFKYYYLTQLYDKNAFKEKFALPRGNKKYIEEKIKKLEFLKCNQGLFEKKLERIYKEIIMERNIYIYNFHFKMILPIKSSQFEQLFDLYFSSFYAKREITVSDCIVFEPIDNDLNVEEDKELFIEACLRIIRIAREKILEYFINEEFAYIHGAFIEVGNRGIAILGKKFSGKTSTTLNALENIDKIKFLANDKFLLHIPTMKVITLPMTIGIRENDTNAYLKNKKAISDLCLYNKTIIKDDRKEKQSFILPYTLGKIFDIEVGNESVLDSIIIMDFKQATEKLFIESVDSFSIIEDSLIKMNKNHKKKLENILNSKNITSYKISYNKQMDKKVSDFITKLGYSHNENT